MIATRPDVTLNGLYSRKEAAKALGINTSTLHRYTERGLIKAHYRRTTNERVWKGEDIIKLWNYCY